MSKLNTQGEAEKQAVVSGSDSRNCQNCKHFNKEKISCNHFNWNTCVVRDKDGYVVNYVYHHYR
jgi:hypothetical protein